MFPFFCFIAFSFLVLLDLFQKKKEDELDGKRKKENMNLVIPFVPSADNSNLSADGDDSFISVDSAMPSPFSEVRLTTPLTTYCFSCDPRSCMILAVCYFNSCRALSMLGSDVS